MPCRGDFRNTIVKLLYGTDDEKLLAITVLAGKLIGTGDEYYKYEILKALMDFLLREELSTENNEKISGVLRALSDARSLNLSIFSDYATDYIPNVKLKRAKRRLVELLERLRNVRVETSDRQIFDRIFL